MPLDGSAMKKDDAKPVLHLPVSLFEIKRQENTVFICFVALLSLKLLQIYNINPAFWEKTFIDRQPWLPWYVFSI